MSGRLYKRALALSFERITHTYRTAFGYDTGYTLDRRLVGTVLDTTTIRDLRVTFKIEKHLASEPNTCNVTVYNLAESSRAAFQVKPLALRLEAGYDGELERLFTGDLRWAQSRLDGVNWETSIQIADGDRAHRFARVSRSFESGALTLDAVRDVVKSMGLTLPKRVESVLRTQHVEGVSVHGNSARELSRLLKPYGLNWSVQDGRLQVLAAGDVRTDEPIEVSQEKGLIGSPEFGAPVAASTGPTGRTRKGKPPILKLRMLLYPGLTPGGRVRVKSRGINGLFRIEQVVHLGDTHGDDWYSEVEAKQVK